MEQFDYYIASGFFTPEALQVVKDQESFYDEEGITYFSPRSITMDLSPNNPDREKNAGILFNKDLEMIHACNSIHVILDESADKGTLFELGYASARKIEDTKYWIEMHGVDGKLNEISAIAEKFMLEMTEIKYSPELLRNGIINSQNKFLLITGSDFYEKTNMIVNLYRMNAEVVKMVRGEFYSILNFIRVGFIPVIVTDENQGSRPIQLYMLMGFLKYYGIKFYTASVSDYGSNIMIASATQGHINLPSIVNPYRSKMKIE